MCLQLTYLTLKSIKKLFYNLTAPEWLYNVQIYFNGQFRQDSPSPLAPCLSLCPTPAAVPALGPLVSSAPLLSSTHFARSVAPGETAARHAAAGTSPAAALCCGGFHSPDTAYETKQSTSICVSSGSGGIIQILYISKNTVKTLCKNTLLWVKVLKVLKMFSKSKNQENVLYVLKVLNAGKCPHWLLNYYIIRSLIILTH